MSTGNKDRIEDSRTKLRMAWRTKQGSLKTVSQKQQIAMRKQQAELHLHEDQINIYQHNHQIEIKAIATGDKWNSFPFRE